MTDLTPERRAAIAARCAKATGGEWTWEDGPATIYAGRTNDQHGMNLFGRLDIDWNGPANLDFVCHARADLPDLLAAIEAAEARADAAESRVKAIEAAGENLWIELQDAAFGYEDVHWKVQRDAPEVLEVWWALRDAQPAPGGGGEGA